MSVYWDFKDDVCDGIYTNVNTLNAHSNTENLWLTTGQALNESWLTQTDGDPNTQGTLAYAIAHILVYSNPPTDTTVDILKSEANMQAFITGTISTSTGINFADPNGHSWLTDIGSWSQATIIQLLGILSQSWDTSTTTSQSSLQQNAILQEGSAIQAQMGQETSTSDSEGKTYGSMVTNDASAGTPFSNAGDDYTGVLSGFANILTTISA